MERSLLTLQNITLSFGDKSIFSNLFLSLKAGDRGAVVGRNGSGKSTLLKVLTGEAEPDSGIRWAHPDVNIVELSQNPNFTGYETVGDYFDSGGQGNWQRIDRLVRELEIDCKSLIRELSGGEARRVAICQTFADDHDVILLDEPTNHLDLETIQWIENRIEIFKGALLTISHDRAFLSSVCDEIFWLDRGVMRRSRRQIDEFELW